MNPNAPFHPTPELRDSAKNFHHAATKGIDIRTAIAAQILAGMVAQPRLASGSSNAKLAVSAIELTDLLLAKLNERN